MFYAMVKPPFAQCFGFNTKRQRDEWLDKQLKRDRERYEKHKAEDIKAIPGLRDDMYVPYTPNYLAISAKEAMKRFGRGTGFAGERAIRYTFICEEDEEP